MLLEGCLPGLWFSGLGQRDWLRQKIREGPLSFVKGSCEKDPAVIMKGLHGTPVLWGWGFGIRRLYGVSFRVWGLALRRRV